MSDEQTDPTSRPWDDLTEDLLGVTERLKAGYRRVADESGPTEEEIRDALRTLGAAWNQVAGSVGEVIRDEEVRTHLKRAASSLADAVGATLSEIVPRSAGPPARGATDQEEGEEEEE